MIVREEIHLIYHGFSVKHIYSLTEVVEGSSIDIGHYDVACLILLDLVYEFCRAYPDKKYKWLIEAVFSNGKHAVFMTAKDAHIHVMVSLETLKNIAPKEEVVNWEML